MTGGFWNLSRATVWLDRGITGRSTAALPRSRPGATRCWRRRSATTTSSTARSSMEEHWLRYGVTGRRKRNVKRLGDLHALREQRREYRGPPGNANLAAAEAEKSGKLVIGAEEHEQVLWRPADRRDFSIRISAATASASSGRTAPARPRWSTC